MPGPWHRGPRAERGCAGQCHGTVFPRVWRMMLGTFVITLPMCFIYTFLDRRSRYVATEVDPGTMSVDPQENFYKFCWHLFHDAEHFMHLATSLLTFVLGFFNSVVFGRWWKLRDLSGAVIGRSMNLIVTTSAIINNGDLKKCHEARRDIVRYIKLGLQLHLLTATQASVEKMRQSLLELNLVQEGGTELHALEQTGAGKYSLAYGWLLQRFNRAIADGLVTEQTANGAFLVVHADMTKMRGSAADVMMYLKTPVPPPFLHLLETMVTVVSSAHPFHPILQLHLLTKFSTDAQYCLLIPAALVPQLRWVAPMVSCVYTFFFYGFFAMGKEVGKPALLPRRPSLVTMQMVWLAPVLAWCPACVSVYLM